MDPATQWRGSEQVNDRPQRRGDRGGTYVPRFAGEAFDHLDLDSSGDGPTARKNTSTVAWKQPPSASLRAEVSV